MPLRPDHGRMIWGGTAIPGYALFDRAIGLAYLHGLTEAFERRRLVAAAPPFPTAEV